MLPDRDCLLLYVEAFQLLPLVLTGWLNRRERDALAYLMEENRVLRPQLGGRRLRLTDDDRRQLAARAYQVGRRALRQITTIVTGAVGCTVGVWAIAGTRPVVKARMDNLINGAQFIASAN